MEKGFEDEVKKLLFFLKGFLELERNKFVMLIGVFLVNGIFNVFIFNSFYNENLVKEGVLVVFVVKFFKLWINEKDINVVVVSFWKVSMDNRLMELFFVNK